MKKQIMKKAWEIRKSAAKKYNVKVNDISMSHCLKLAWEERNKNMNDEKIKSAINETYNYIDNTDHQDQSGEFWYSTTIQRWQKYDKDRIYINMSYGRYYKGRTKWKRGVSYCVDLQKNTIFDSSNTYGNAAEKRTVEQAANFLLDYIK